MGPPADPPPQDPPPLTPAQLLDIQGDIWSKGFPKYNETYYFFSIEKAAEFTHCLKELLKGERPLISNLARVKKDQEDIAADKKKAEDKAIVEGKTAKDAVIIVKDLANALIAFSSDGLQIIQDALPNKVSLKLSVIESTDPGFFNGMDSKDVKNAINDPDKGTWDELFRSDKIHGLLKIGGSSETEVDKLLGKIKAALKPDTVIKDVVEKSLPTDKNSRVDGATRLKELRGKEHFGFEDGISQPLMGGIDKLEPKPDGKEGFVVNMNTDPKLLIVTGGSASGKGIARPTWMHNGSFLVLRKLEQHVGAFRALTAKYNDYNCKNAAHMGAKLMGRWQSGAPIAVPEFRTQDSTDADKAKLINNFGYTDKIGCPVAAHVRKTNVRENFSRNEGDQAAPRVRIIRNGIPYGTEYTGDKNDKSTRGLLFACYQARIEDGFQHMQGNWANGKDFRNTKDAGLDPIIGQPESKDNGMIITKITDQEGRDKELKFPPLVTLKGGGYFFVPSIEALEKHLSADPPK